MTGCRLGSITWHGLITQYVTRDLKKRGIDEAALNKVWSITDLRVVGKHTKAKKIKQYVALSRHGRSDPVSGRAMGCLWQTGAV